MRRVEQTPRPDAYALVEAEGLAYARERNTEGAELPYWFEGAAYRFTESQVDHLESVTAELHAMALHATRVMARDETTLDRLGLPGWCRPALRASVEEHDWSLYGRFDLVWDGEGAPKLLEYNADTPAALVEAAVSQWHWLEAMHPDLDQWNLLHECLVESWRKRLPVGSTVHLAAGANEPLEDWNTVEYLADTVREAGHHPRILAVEEIGLVEDGSGRFVDLAEAEITTCFSMYPWEWMLDSRFGRPAVEARTTWLEPVWKVLTGSKALLVALWQLYPDHPNLLAADWSPERLGSDYAAKPVYGWEGAGTRIVLGGETVATTGARHTAGQQTVFQRYHRLPDFDGNLPVLGTWVIDGRAAGLGIRETDAGRLITDTGARFVPHLVVT